MSAPAQPALAVDRTRCDGHGLCAALLPGRVARDEWGFPVLYRTAVADTDQRDVGRAIAACPSLALYLSVPSPPVPSPAAKERR
jgi:ferredoxin